jgi:serine/threonine protein kinase
LVEKVEEIEFEKVAIKMLRKDKILEQKMGIKSLLNEIRVHWTLEQCGGVLQLIAIHEDQEMIYLVLEYQPKGTLMNTLQN